MVVAMAFKVPLPKVLESQHNSKKSCEHPVGAQLNLPSFNKSDLSNLTLIGVGAFGKVFKCVKDGETYVMKQNVDVNPDSSEIQLFWKEAGLLKTLKGHENVVEIHGFSHRDNAILLEYVSFSFSCLGIVHDVVSTLKELLDACDTLNNFVGFEHLHMYIATDVAAGLHFLHSRNVAHRDLKPANVLVSNSHYAGNADVTGYWSVRPVIAKLSDFGESRSSLLQTNTLAKTSTGRLNRGSPAYMAPEALDGSDFKAHLQNLFAMDVWSFAMTLFQLINPNIRHPYAIEMDTKPNDMDCLDMLKQLNRMRALPKNDCKYSPLQNAVWLPLQNVYIKCAQYSAVDRPLAKDIVQMLVNEYVEVHRLVLRPPVLAVDHEIRVRYQSEKITLHESAYSMLNLLKDQNTTYDAYNVLQSPQVSASHDILFPLLSATPKTAADAKLELCLCLSAVLADDSFHFAVYTLLPYSFFLCKDSNGKVVLVQLPVDVNTSAGLNTITAVSPLDEDVTVAAIGNWMFNNMDLSCDVPVCYKLASLKPLKQTSPHTSASNFIGQQTNLHMECSNISSPVSSLNEDNSDSEQDCGSSGILKNRGNNRWRTSENSISNWQSCNEDLVESLPHDINGLRKYRLRCNAKRKDQVMKITKDGRPWKMWTSSSRKGFNGVRRIARCGGGFTCTLASCPFELEHGKPNKLHFRKQCSGADCFVCGLPAEHISCPAVKIWEFDKACVEVVVYHRGEHTCAVKKRKLLSNAAILKAVRQNPSAKPSRLVQQEMVGLMTADDFVWTDIETVADNLADLKRVQYERQKVKQIMNPCGENFEALALLKQKCMEKDTYFVYKINDRALNGSPSFVLKSSTNMVQLAIDMDRDGSGILNKEYAHVDAKHNRVRGFKSVTLWAYHPVLCKLVRLAVMDVEQENSENLTSFWTLFNEMLQAFSGISDYKFNPTGFIADEHHANWTSIRNVFGAAVVNRMVSCEFHFKQSVQRHAKYLKPSGASDFICLAERMLTAVSMSDFHDVSQSMQQFVQDHDCLKDWYGWWYKRRMHIFRAFKGDEVPRSNLAEVGHAKMESVGRPYMSLLEAAKEDVASAIRQEAELRLFPEGVATGGKGMNLHQRMARQYKSSMKRAKAFAKEIHLQSSLTRQQSFVPTSGVHRPPTIRRATCRKQKTVVKASHQTAQQGKGHGHALSKEPTADVSNAGGGKTVRPSNKCVTSLAKSLLVRAKSRSVSKKQLAPTAQTKVITRGNGPDYAALVCSAELSFTVVLLTQLPKVQVCYGCGLKFAGKFRLQPNDLILRTCCRRRYTDKSGVQKVSSKVAAAYCHLKMNCIKKINPSAKVSSCAIGCIM